ncbi:MAG: epimerase [Acidobacteriota bacterium]|nr:epimerase [Acidobacteriota bacterium]
MNILLFGGSGMVGQGVLRECLLDPAVRRVAAVVRKPTGQQHGKLREIVHTDFVNLAPIQDQLANFDVCFFCLGQTSVGMSEADYRRVTYDLSMSVAETLVKVNPAMTFFYVSGAGTDSTEKGRSMWARVKGQTENALLKLPFKAAYMIRPAGIVPLHGIRSKTKLYNALYLMTAPLLNLAYRWFPKYMTTTEQLGRAMLRVAKEGYAKSTLESSDINQL